MDIWEGAHDESWEHAQEALAKSGMSDGLPVVPPTRQRVDSALRAAGVDSSTIVATLPPAFAEVTWRDVAINAVLAGCAPEYLRVVGAAVAAMGEPDFNLLGISTTTGSATVCIVVNGPVAAAIGMNSGANAFGPGNRANATIGRAVCLTLRNAAGARPGEIDMATLGQPGKYTFCFAENEGRSPWPPLHVDRGFASDTSVATVFGVSGTIEMVDSESADAETLAQTFAQSMLIAGNVGSAGLLGGSEPLVVMPPEHAEAFAREGLTKAQVKALIYERALLSIERLAPKQRARAAAGGGASDGYLRVAKKADDIAVVVAGGVGRKAAYVPTWSGGTKSVSRKIVSPA